MNKRSLLILSAAFAAVPAFAADSISVINPSFQADDFPTFPGYIGQPGNPGAITGWTGAGGVGINGLDIGAGAPFADNGLFPDNSRAAFIQGTGSLSQNLSGFNVGDLYWVQGFYDARNCCGDFPVGTVTLAGNTLSAFGTILPVEAGGSRTLPWYFANLPWTATAASGALTIGSTPSAGGDASLVFDGVSVIRRTAADIVIANPSFEASGNSFAFPGYVGAPLTIAGWLRTGGGQIAINGSNGSGNPFADNGTIPDGGNVLGLQQDLTVSQTLSGLTVGALYRLIVEYNSRSGDDPAALIKIDGQTALSGLVPEVGGANPYYHLEFDFTASGTSTLLEIANLGLAGDSTLLVDNVRVVAVPEPAAVVAILGGIAVLIGLQRRR